MRRLLVFTENHVRGGGNRYMIDSVNGVSVAFDSIVIVSNPGGIYPEEIARLKCEIAMVGQNLLSREYSLGFLKFLPSVVRSIIVKLLKPIDPILFFLNLLNLVFLLRKFRPAAVLSCNGGYPAAYSTLAMVIAAKFMGIPCALTVVSLPSPRGFLLFPYEWLVDYLVRRSATVIIVNAGAIRQALSEKRGIAANKMVIVHNGLDDILGPPPFVENTEVKRMTVGCVARMDRAKGILFLLEAFAPLAVKYQDLHLVLVGRGNASEELATRVRELGLSDRVTLTGYYEGDILNLIQSFDIYVFPSLWEGFPYSILEAMGAGCAIVATNVGGIPEAIRDGQEGLLVAPASEFALAQAIETLVKDGELRTRIRAMARRRYEENFSLSLMKEKIINVFTETVLADKK